MKDLMSALAVLLLALALAICAWYMGRTINYRLSYRSMVQEEIRRMVKPECLQSRTN